MNKENLNLPWEAKYNRHYQSYDIHESPAIDDSHGNNRVGEIYHKIDSAFVVKAVNTYHEREELIMELIERLEFFCGFAVCGDDVSEELNLIQKAKEVLATKE